MSAFHPKRTLALGLRPAGASRQSGETVKLALDRKKLEAACSGEFSALLNQRLILSWQAGIWRSSGS